MNDFSVESFFKKKNVYHEPFLFISWKISITQPIGETFQLGNESEVAQSCDYNIHFTFAIFSLDELDIL